MSQEIATETELFPLWLWKAMSYAIESIETIPLRSSLESSFGYSQAWVDERSALLVRIDGTNGVSGWGECWGPIAGTKEVVDDFLAPQLIGENASDPEKLYDQLYQSSRAAYQSVVPLPALSGVDIALWDLKGKSLDQSVAELLGGQKRSSVRAYATGHYFKRGADLEEQYRLIEKEADENASQFGAVKAKIGLQLLGYGPEEDIELVRRIRQTIGQETTLMVDANYAYDIGTAREVGERISEFDIYWFEEPINPKLIDGYSHLREQLNTRIAGGECNTPYEIAQMIKKEAIDITQPDICNVGGFTPVKRLSYLSKESGIQLIPHVWGSPIALGASLQLLSTVHGNPWLEFDLSSNPLRTDLAATEFSADDGEVTIPDKSGIGVEPDPDIIEKYRE